jgi:hypothetical protein
MLSWTTGISAFGYTCCRTDQVPCESWSLAGQNRVVWREADPHVTSALERHRVPHQHATVPEGAVLDSISSVLSPTPKPKLRLCRLTEYLSGSVC